MKFKNALTLILLAGLLKAPSALAETHYCPNFMSDGKVVYMVQEIPVYELIPTQYAMGKGAVEEIKAKYYKEGDFVKTFRKRFSQKPLPVVLGPTKDGGKAYYVKDNHHMVIPVAEEYSSGKLYDDKALVCVAVETDASDLKWDDFIQSLHAGNFSTRIGYFNPDTRNELAKKASDPVEFQRVLERSYDEMFSHHLNELEDSPYRTLISEVMTMKLRIKGRDFNEYIEFLLAEKVQTILGTSFDLGSKIASLKVFEVLFGNPEVLQYWKSQLKSNLDSDRKKKVLQSIDGAAQFYNDELKDLEETRQIEKLNQFFDSKKKKNSSTERH